MESLQEGSDIPFECFRCPPKKPRFNVDIKVYAVIVTTSDNILLVNSNRGKFRFVGGHLENTDKNIVECIKRECGGEIGFSPENLNIDGIMPLSCSYTKDWGMEIILGIDNSAVEWKRTAEGSLSGEDIGNHVLQLQLQLQPKYDTRPKPTLDFFNKHGMTLTLINIFYTTPVQRLIAYAASNITNRYEPNVTVDPLSEMFRDPQDLLEESYEEIKISHEVVRRFPVIQNYLNYLKQKEEPEFQNS